VGFSVGLAVGLTVRATTGKSQVDNTRFGKHYMVRHLPVITMLSTSTVVLDGALT
jgi:hypothetical protein